MQMKQCRQSGTRARHADYHITGGGVDRSSGKPVYIQGTPKGVCPRCGLMCDLDRIEGDPPLVFYWPTHVAPGETKPRFMDTSSGLAGYRASIPHGSMASDDRGDDGDFDDWG